MTLPISITNLTNEQVEMLDHLWTLETMADVENFKSDLPLFRRQQVDTLIELIRLQVIDDSIDTGDMPEFDTVDALLENIRKIS
jgi:hypothetical protein